MRIPRITPNWSLLVSAVVLTILASLWVGQNAGFLMPVSASVEAKLIDDLFNFMLVIATGIFIGVQGLLLYSAFAFRRTKGDMTDGPPVHDNLKLEIFWTAIPTVLVLYLSVYSFDVFQQIGATDPMTGAHHDTGLPAKAIAQIADPSAPPPLVIQVQAQQYAWIFTYPEKNITAAELHLPLNRPVRLEMKSEDVIHAFWVPQFRLKQDVIPGRTTYVAFTPDKAGQYQLRCAELCGAYHGGMNVDVFVEDQKKVDEWLTSQASLSVETRIAQALPPAARNLPVTWDTPVLETEQTRTLVSNLRSEGQ